MLRPDPLITVEEAAAELRLTRRAVLVRVKQRKIACVRGAKSPRFTRAQIDAYIAGQIASTGQDDELQTERDARASGRRGRRRTTAGERAA